VLVALGQTEMFLSSLLLGLVEMAALHLVFLRLCLSTTLERLLVAVVAVVAAAQKQPTYFGLVVVAGVVAVVVADSQATQTRLAGLEEITPVKILPLLLPERVAQFHLLVLTA
jgi:hypothetical protein